MSPKPEPKNSAKARENVSTPSFGTLSAGRLSALAVDHAQERLGALQLAVLPGGLSQQQIDGVNLEALLRGTGRLWRRLWASLCG